MSPKNYASFLFGVASLVGGTVVTMIWPTIDSTLGYWILAACGLSFVAAAVLYFLPAPEPIEAAVSDESKRLFDQRILISGENSGTISPTYNNTVNLGIHPELILIEEPRLHKNTDGTMITVCRTRMSSPASRLHVQAVGDNLLSMNISRPPSAGACSTSKMEVRRWADGNTINESFANPSGEYSIEVKTSDDRPPKIANQVDP
jgi:hypothetical protein